MRETFNKIINNQSFERIGSLRVIQRKNFCGCDCVNLFDTDTGVIAIYQKQPDGSNLFLTTCKLTQMERDHLKATNGNFVTERILKEQIAVSTEII